MSLGRNTASRILGQPDCRYCLGTVVCNDIADARVCIEVVSHAAIRKRLPAEFAILDHEDLVADADGVVNLLLGLCDL